MALAAIRARNQHVSLAGKNAVVVGGTSGIGKGIALRLADANCDVTIVGRDLTRGNEVVEEMKTRGKGLYQFVPVDAQLLKNARTFAQNYSQAHPTLDYLVLTQGIGTMRGYTPTAEGIDQKLALHYYSRMAFVDQLLPLLRNSSDARVLTVLSPGIHPPYPHYKEDPDLSRGHYSLKNAADAGCFYNDLAVDSLSRENPTMTFIHAAPGFVSTNLGAEMPWYIRGLVRAIQPFGASIHDCAEFMCESLSSPEVKGGFRLIGSKAQPVGVSSGHSEEARTSVWEHTKSVLARAFSS